MSSPNELERTQFLLDRLHEETHCQHRSDKVNAAVRCQWQNEVLAKASAYAEAMRYLALELNKSQQVSLPNEPPHTNLESLRRALVQQIRTASGGSDEIDNILFDDLPQCGSIPGAHVMAFVEESYLRLIQQVKSLPPRAAAASPSRRSGGQVTATSAALHALCAEHAKGLSDIPSASTLERVRELQAEAQRKISSLPRDRQKAVIEGAHRAGLTAALAVVKRHLAQRDRTVSSHDTTTLRERKLRIDALEAERREKLALLSALLDNTERRSALARRWRETLRLHQSLSNDESIPVVLEGCRDLLGYVPRVTSTFEEASRSLTSGLVPVAIPNPMHKTPPKSIAGITTIPVPQYPIAPKLGFNKKDCLREEAAAKAGTDLMDRLKAVQRRTEHSVEELKACHEAKEVWFHQPAKYLVVDPVAGSGAEAAARYMNT